MKGPEPIALRRAQHTLADEHGFTAFGTLADIDAPHRVALVDGRPVLLVWWAPEAPGKRAAALEAAALIGERDDIAYIWATATGRAGDGHALRVGADGVVPVDRLPDVAAFAPQPLGGRLDRVDWGRLTDAYGPATTTRDHLETLLTSADPALREDAVFRLYMGICHQTVSLSEATAPAIPFLVAAGERRDEIEVLRLLADIAELAALPVDDLPPEEAAWSRRSAMALGASAERFASWVSGADDEDRRQAALRLALAARRAAPGAAAPLDAVLDEALAHAEPTMRMLAVQALAADGNRDRLRGALADPALQVRAFAAVPFLAHADAAPRAAAWAAIAEVLADPDVTDGWYRATPGLDGHPLPDLLEAVAAAGRPAADPVLPRLVELLAGWRVAALIAPVLRVFFPDRRLPDPRETDRWQTAALAALCRNRRFWRSDERQLLPAPLDGDTTWTELRDHVAALPARAALTGAEAAFEFPPLPPSALAAEIARDAVFAAPECEAEVAGRKVRQLRLGPEVDDAVFAALCALCDRLQRLELVGARLTDQGFRPLAALDRLTHLRIDDVPLHGPGLDALDHHPRLRELRLVGLAFGDAPLAVLAGLPRLAELVLCRMALTGDGLTELREAPVLAGLMLRGCTLDRGAWRALGAIEALEDLRLCDTTLPRGALAGWCGLERLTRLSLDTCVVPPGAFHGLPELPLRRISLHGCAVDEAELRALARLPHLRDLVLSRTPLSEAAVDVLAAFPRGIRLGLAETGLSETATRRLKRLRRRPR
ncbi:MAG: hypothetical protein R3F65_16200 [bacterium]|nr:hypothetical protein [Myxococcales bacterium]MCB9552483.1 hypothetical protein [Myxococcales bacterium]